MKRVVLISHAMWQQRFNGDAAILGQALTLDGAPYTIIGVLPEAASAFPLNQLQIWVPRPAEVPYLVPAQLNNGGVFLPGRRAAPSGRLARAGARGDERHRRRLSRGAPGQRRRAVDRSKSGAVLDDAVGDAAAELPDAVRRGRLRAADRVREHRQPDAGALRRPPQGDRRALRARREPGRRDAPARDREPGRGGARRRGRRAAGAVGARRRRRAGRRPDSARAGNRHRPGGARLRVGGDARHRAGHRPAARRGRRRA